MGLRKRQWRQMGLRRWEGRHITALLDVGLMIEKESNTMTMV